MEFVTRITPLPPLQCLVAFELAVRHGSFTKAAIELHRTQSAINRQIAKLEDFFSAARCSYENTTHFGQRRSMPPQSVLCPSGQSTVAVTPLSSLVPNRHKRESPQKHPAIQANGEQRRQQSQSIQRICDSNVGFWRLFQWTSVR